MAIEFVHGFDDCSTLADLMLTWTASSVSPSVSAGAGRRGGNALLLNSTSEDITKTLTAVATRGVHMGFKAAALPSADNVFLRFLEGGTTHVAVRLNIDGTISVLRSATVLATSVNALSAGVFYHIEVKVTIDNAAGAYEVKVNGSSSGWLAGTGADTQNGGTATTNQVQLAGSVAEYYFDDFITWNTSGSAPNNDFLGDKRVDLKLPSGNGNSSQLDGSDGNSVDNYQHVDDATPDGDTTYVESDTATEKDTYAFADLSHTPPVINAVQIKMIAKKTDSGTRSIASVTRSGGSDTDGTTQPLTTDYLDYREILALDPNTAAAWTESGFNAAEFGMKVAA